jgi:hypothetical protein
MIEPSTRVLLATTLRQIEDRAQQVTELLAQINDLSCRLHDLGADDSVSDSTFDDLEEVTEDFHGADQALRRIRNRAHKVRLAIKR